MNSMGVNSNLSNVLPKELSTLDSFHLWKYSFHNKGKPAKTPVNKSGYSVGYNDVSLPMPFSDAFKEATAKDCGVGITLKEGLYIDTVQGYLWCMDFDGFAELKGTHVDDGVIEILDKFKTRLANGEPVAGVAAAIIAAGLRAFIPEAIANNAFRVLLVIPIALIAISKDKPILFN